jgi:hypothetical protein
MGPAGPSAHSATRWFIAERDYRFRTAGDRKITSRAWCQVSRALFHPFFSVYSTIVQYIFFFGRHPQMLVPILTTCLHGVLNYLTYLPYSWVCLSLFKVICCFQMENPPLDPFGEPTPQQTQIGNWHVCDLGGTSNQDQPSPGVNSRIVDRNCRRTV